MNNENRHFTYALHEAVDTLENFSNYLSNKFSNLADNILKAEKEVELKESIKYCKNPMLKSKLERELSDLKSNSSKHKKSKKRRK